MSEYPEQQIQRKSPIITTFIVVIILLAIGALVLYFIQPAEIATTPTAPTEIETIPTPTGLLLNVIFASSIDSRFVYAIKPNAEYVQDKGIYLYLETRNFVQSADFNIDVSESLEIKDSTGKVVFSRNNFAVNKQKYTEKMAVVKFSNAIPTIGWKTGTYSAFITVNDNLGGKSVTKTLEFSIKEKSKEIVEKTIDLSGIVSANLPDTQLVRKITVTDLAGNVIPELSYSQTMTGDLSTLDLTKIDSSFKIPERFDAGTYIVEVRYTNTQNGKSIAVRETIVVTKELAVEKMVFAKSIDSDYNYVLQPNSVYKKGDTIYIYLRLVDFAQPAVGGKYHVKFSEDVSVLDETGTVVISKINYLNVDEQISEKKDNYDIKNAFTSGTIAAGKYNFRAVVKDLNSGQQTTKEESFWLE